MNADDFIDHMKRGMPRVRIFWRDGADWQGVAAWHWFQTFGNDVDGRLLLQAVDDPETGAQANGEFYAVDWRDIGEIEEI